MEAKLYRAASEGDVSILKEDNVERHGGEAYFLSTTPQGNNIIHIAVEYGWPEFVGEALAKFPMLLYQKNKIMGDTPLHVAMRHGNLQTLRLLVNSILDSQSDSNEITAAGTSNEVDVPKSSAWMPRNVVGDTPLHVALRHGDAAAACEFLQVVNHCSEIVSSVNNSSQIPLHLCVNLWTEAPTIAMHNLQFKKPRIDLAGQSGIGGTIINSFLLEKLVNDCTAVCLDKEGLTPLLRAAKMGALSIARFIIERCPTSVDVHDLKDRNVLHLLDSLQNYEQLHMFVTIPHINVLVNVQDCEGNTPAHLAVVDADVVKFQVLSDLLADFTIKNNEGVSVKDLLHAQDRYAEKMEVEIGKTLITKMDDGPPTRAANKHRFEPFQGIFDSKCTLYVTPRGSNILHMAIQKDDSRCFIEFVRQTPNLILAQDLNGDTALHIAARFGNPTAKLLVRSLKDYLRKVEESLQQSIQIYPWKMKNLQGFTPLHEALRTSNVDIALEMIKLDRGFWLSYKDDSDTPLHLLARYATNSFEKLESIELLVKLNSWAIFQHDSDGLIPLMRAAKCSNMLVASLIVITHPQAVEVRDKSGRSFLHHLRLRTIANNNTRERDDTIWMCKFLLNCSGVDNLIFSMDHEGNTPLHLAVKNRDFDMANLLIQRSFEIESSRVKNKTLKDNEGKPIIDLLAYESFNDTESKLVGDFLISQSSKKNEDNSMTDFITSGTGNPASMKVKMERPKSGRIMVAKLYNAASNGDVSFLCLRRSSNAIDLKNEENEDINDKDIPRHEDHENDAIYDDNYFHCQAHDGSNIIHIAIQREHKSFVENALQRFPSLAFQMDSNGNTPMHLAARMRSCISREFLQRCCRNWWLNVQEDKKFIVCLPPWRVKILNGNTFLHEAARTSNYEIISFLQEYVDSTAFSDVNDNLETPLHLFARYGTYVANDNLEVLQMLVASGPTTSYMRDMDGLTPALRAIKSGRIRVALLILEQNPLLIDICDYMGKTILHHLQPLDVELEDGRCDMTFLFEKLFKLPGIDKLRNKPDKEGNTPLHLAIKTANGIVAKFLVERCLQSEEDRQELTIINNDGCSIFDLISSQIHISEMKEIKEIIMRKSYVKERLLLREMMTNTLYNATIEADHERLFDNEGRDPTDSDIEKGFADVEDSYFRTRTPDGSNIVHLALRQGKLKAVDFIDKALSRFPELILEIDSNGDTPLHLAAKLDESNNVLRSLLIKAKYFYENACKGTEREIFPSPCKMKNNEGNMPIHEALRSLNFEAISALLEYDPEGVSYINGKGETPLHFYAKHRPLIFDVEKEIFKKLIIGCNTNAAYMRDAEGLTPLMRAAMGPNFGNVLAILEHFPQSAYLQCPKGRTFLHLLHFEIAGAEFNFDYPNNKYVPLILFKVPEVEAQIWIRDYDGNTPLHYAIKTGNFTLVEVFLRGCQYPEDRFSHLLYIQNNDGDNILKLLTTYKAPNEIWKQVENRLRFPVQRHYDPSGTSKAEIKERAGSLYVIAGLLATVTFAAVLQVPGGFDDKSGFPNLLRNVAFQVFLVSDSFAMCGSMLVLFSLLWLLSHFGSARDSFILFDLSLTVLQASFYAAIVAFMTGVYATTAHDSLWLAIFVCVVSTFVILISSRKTTLAVIKVLKRILGELQILRHEGFSLKKYRMFGYVWRQNFVTTRGSGDHPRCWTY